MSPIDTPSEDNSPSVSVLGKRRHRGNDNGRIFDSDDNEKIFDSGDDEGDFGEAVEGDDSQELEGGEDPVGLLPVLPVPPCS